MKMCAGCAAENEMAYCGNNDPLTPHTCTCNRSLAGEELGSQVRAGDLLYDDEEKDMSSIGLEDDYSDLRITVDKA